MSHSLFDDFILPIFAWPNIRWANSVFVILNLFSNIINLMSRKKLAFNWIIPCCNVWNVWAVRICHLKIDSMTKKLKSGVWLWITHQTKIPCCFCSINLTLLVKVKWLSLFCSLRYTGRCYVWCWHELGVNFTVSWAPHRAVPLSTWLYYLPPSSKSKSIGTLCLAQHLSCRLNFRSYLSCLVAVWSIYFLCLLAMIYVCHHHSLVLFVMAYFCSLESSRQYICHLHVLSCASDFATNGANKNALQAPRSGVQESNASKQMWSFI